MSEIVIENLSKTFLAKDGTVEALKNVNLSIGSGDIYGIIGMSGAGKSTLVRCMNFLETPSQGRVLINGKSLGDYSEKELRKQRESIGMIFQHFNLLMQKNVLENVCFPLYIQGKKKKEAHERAKELLEIVGLSEKQKAYPAQLSGGQKQRVAMGRAIVRKPKVFLMDEPLSNLDAKLRNQMRGEISKLYQELDSTFIYVTHDQVEAMTLGTKIVVLKDGEIQQVATPQELYNYPANVFVAGFIGTPPMNLWEGACVPVNGVLHIQVGDALFPLPEQIAENIRRKNYINQDIIVGIRAEDIKLAADGELEGTVEVYEMLGDYAYLYFNYAGQKVSVRVPADTAVQRGDTIRMTFDMEKIHLFDKLREKRI